MGSIKGRKALQKLVYLSRAFGINDGYSFRYYYFGPYSDALSDDIDNLIDDYTIQGKNSAFVIKKMPVYDAIGDAESKKIDKLIKHFGNMSPLELELYATIIFIDRNEKYVFNDNDEERIIQEVIKAKPGSDKRKIKKAYECLKKYNLLYNTAQK